MKEDTFSDKFKYLTKRVEETVEDRQTDSNINCDDDQFNVYERLYSLHSSKPKPLVGKFKQTSPFVKAPQPVESVR